MKTEEIISEHDKRLSTLEENDREQDRRIRELEKSFTKLESTIIQENRETRMIFQSTMNKQWDLIKTRDIAKENENQREHEFRKSKFEKNTDLAIKLLGAGGLVYLFVQSVLSTFTN